MLLTRWLISGWAACAVIALMACDPRGRGYEDARLARLTEGESTGEEVRKLFGNPAGVRDIAGGKGWVYPLGPENPYTLLMKIDANGKYQGRENLLTRANFARVRRGMKEVDVLIMLGRPARAERYPLEQQSSWEWRFLDGNDTRLFVVTFDAGGTVVSSVIEDDSRRSGA